MKQLRNGSEEAEGYWWVRLLWVKNLWLFLEIVQHGCPVDFFFCLDTSDLGSFAKELVLV